MYVYTGPAGRLPTRCALAEVEFQVWQVDFVEVRTLNASRPTRIVGPITPVAADAFQWQPFLAAV